MCSIILYDSYIHLKFQCVYIYIYSKNVISYNHLKFFLLIQMSATALCVKYFPAFKKGKNP